MKWIWALLLILLACTTAAFTALARSSDSMRTWIGEPQAIDSQRHVDVVPVAAPAEAIPLPAKPETSNVDRQATLAMRAPETRKLEDQLDIPPTADEVVRRAAARAVLDRASSSADSAQTEASDDQVPATDADHQPKVLIDFATPASSAVEDNVFVPVGSGPSAFWDFNSSSDSAFEVGDSSEAATNDPAKAHPATLFGKVQLGVPGPNADAKTAVVFDGETSYVEADSIQVYNTPIHGLSFWVRSVPELAKGGVIYSESSYADYFSVGGSPDGRLLRIVVAQNDFVRLEHYSRATVFDGDWHYVWIYNDEGHIVVNIDGKVDSSATYQKQPLKLTQTTIGAIRRSPARGFFGGAIDDVAIFQPTSVVQMPGAMFLGDPSKLPLLLTGPTSGAAGAAAAGPASVLLIDENEGNELSPFRP